MTNPRIAEAADLAARLEVTFTAAQTTRAEAVLDDVSAVARKLSGDSDRWVTTDEPPVADAPADVVAVVLAAARRLFRNPDAFASEQDGDYSYRIDSDSLAAGGGTFTGSETDLLHSYRDTSELWTLQVEGSLEGSRYSEGILERVWNATLGTET